MKKIFKVLAFAVASAACLAFTSCEWLEDLADDAFSGPADNWVQVSVKYDKDGLTSSNVKLAFFYTEVEREGHIKTVDTALKFGSKIEPGLTIVAFGGFSTNVAGLGTVSLNRKFEKHIPIEAGAKSTWNLIYTASPQLRDLVKKNQVVTGGDIVGGKNFGLWVVAHPEDYSNGQIPDHAEEVPAPLSNTPDVAYEFNSTESGAVTVDWNSAFGKIGLGTSMFN